MSSKQHAYKSQYLHNREPVDSATLVVQKTEEIRRNFGLVIGRRSPGAVSKDGGAQSAQQLGITMRPLFL
jgi:hypothetical protein